MVKSSLDDQATHDLKWAGTWATSTVVFAVLAHVIHGAGWLSAALVTGAFLFLYGVASFCAWRDRVAQAKRVNHDGT